MRYKFETHELVCKHMFAKYREDQLWMFLDERLLETLHVIREQILKVEMTINNYQRGGSFSQRGCRCNMCDIVKSKSVPYLSAHVLGKGVDFDAKGMSAEAARKLIIAHADLLPYPIRIEKDVNWVHIDVYDDRKGNKITLFNG